MYFNLVLHFYMFTMTGILCFILHIYQNYLMLSMWGVVYVFQLIKRFKFRLGLLSLQQAFWYMWEI